MISLFISRGNEKGSRYSVGEDPITVGRDLSNAICLTDLETSRIHCEIVATGDGNLKVTDLNSSNGTYLNGNLRTEGVVSVGDRIQLGNTVLQVLRHDQVTPVASSQSSIDDVIEKSTLAPGVELANSVNGDRFFSEMSSNLRFMYQASLATSKKEVEPMLDDVLGLIFDWIQADRGCILMREGLGKRLRAKAIKYRNGEQQNKRLKISRDIINHVEQNSIGILSSDRYDEETDETKRMINSDVAELLCVPILGRNFGLGLIYVDRLSAAGAGNSFNKDHLKLLHVIAHQTAAAWENSEYYSALLEKERILAVGETAEKLSHRIKNILQSINGGSHLVETGLNVGDVETIKRGWAIVARNQSRISRLVLNMMEMNEEYIPHKEEFDLVEMVNYLIHREQKIADGTGVAIDYESVTAKIEILGDREALENALTYVINEAVKNSRGVESPRVYVRLERDESKVEIFIRSAEADVGDGISSNRQSKIFSAGREFFPGLELSAAKKILKGHGGNVDISNTVSHEDYRVWMPVKQPTVAVPPDEPSFDGDIDIDIEQDDV